MALSRRPPYNFTLSSYYSKKLGFGSFYLPDLDRLKEYLETRAEKVVIKAGDSYASAADDLREATSAELSEVVLRTDNPSLSVVLTHKRAEVWTLESDAKVNALVDDVTAYVRKNHGSVLPKLHGHYLILAIGGFFSLLYWPVIGLLRLIFEPTFSFGSFFDDNNVIILFNVGFGAFFVTQLFFQLFGKGSFTVHATTRDEQRKSGRSNKALVVSTLGASVVTGVVTYLVTVATVAGS